jgi:hypothetical protein
MKTYPKELNDILDGLDTLKSIELLEYNNKNWLSGDNASRSMAKVELTDQIIDGLKSYIHKTYLDNCSS